MSGNTLSAGARTATPIPSKYMHDLDDSPNKFVKAMRHVYRPLGFKKGYNFPLCKLSLPKTPDSQC